MIRQKKARVAAQADNKSQHHSIKPVSKYRAKQYQRTSMGVAMLQALRGGQHE